MTENTLEKLAQLLEQDQFELIFSESGAGRGQDIRLVYLMNDAVESFLVFRDARMTGEYHAEYEGELEASLNKQGEEFVLVTSGEISSESQRLRPGDTVIVAAENLYDGKVLN